MKTHSTILILLLFSVLVTGKVGSVSKRVPSNLVPFCSWWETGLNAVMEIDTSKPLPFKRRELVKNDFLYHKIFQRSNLPKEITGNNLKAITLYKNNKDTTYLVFPTVNLDSVTSDDERMGLEIKLCNSNSWIYSTFSEKCLPTDEMPPCEDDFEVYLYYLEGELLPLIQITSNGPACVPSRLYYFIKKKNTWVLIREICTA